MAQGAFNYGKVKTTTGKEQQFDQTRMARFRYDGSDFDITSQGPCNIWGLVIDGNGEAWIQEANDYGYPMMPFHQYANYPGCSNPQWKSYAPEFPPSAPDFAMGGTGLSGLTLSDASAWPAPYGGLFYIANPITRKIQIIEVTPDGPRFRYQKQPDFLLSSDEWFRPVCIHFGPDGYLYIVDWYNKIISHNEVPRNHPGRDKKRGRIWRVRHRDQKPFEAPDFTRLSGEELLAKLGGPSLPQSHFAWQAITDRMLVQLAPKLKDMVAKKSLAPERRIAALWALEGLRQADGELLKPILHEDNRNLRREALRAWTENPGLKADDFAFLADDPDPEVRAQTVRSAGVALSLSLNAGDSDLPPAAIRAFDLLLKLARPSLDGPTTKSTSNGHTIKIGEAYDREFERYLVRQILEAHPDPLAKYLNRDNASSFPAENRLLATLALEPRMSASRVAELLPQLTRPLGEEELLRLAQFPDEPGVKDVFDVCLNNPATRNSVLQSLLNVRTRFDAAKLEAVLAKATRLLVSEASQPDVELGLKMAGAFRVTAAEPELVSVLRRESSSRPPLALGAVRALSELKSDQVELFVHAVEKGDSPMQEAATIALAKSRDAKGPQELARLFARLNPSLRRTALAGLTSTRAGGEALLKAIQAGTISKDDLDSGAFDKLDTIFQSDSKLSRALEKLTEGFPRALRLNGNANAWSETDITLDGPFTVETWVKLDAGIDNNDGIIGAPGVMDMNFFNGHFRVWVAGTGDVVTAQKGMVADAWTHLAVTRDQDGRFLIYRNGELDSTNSSVAPQRFEKLQIGRAEAGKGTGGWLAEFRVWNRKRSPEELRADFDKSFDDGNKPDGLVFRAADADSWGNLNEGAKLARTADFPNLLTAVEAKALAEKFARFRELANQPGDATRGVTVFSTLCMKCHSVGGNGGQIGPVLNGAGALGVEALLRNILTPNAAMEPGYRTFRVELKNGDLVDGLLVSEDKQAIVLRRQSVPDLRIPQETVLRARFTRLSMMPEGLLEGLKPGEVSDLFAYLQTLR
jgi:putative heme-binding domain-containing protein